jgi:hypothetical protein
MIQMDHEMRLTGVIGVLCLCVVGFASGAGARAGAAQGPASTRSAREPLWQSPTAGQPIELRFLPPGVQAVVVWRAADFMAHPEAVKILGALGAWGDWLNGALPAQTGVPLANCQRVTIGLTGAGPDAPAVCVVVQANEPLNARALNSVWKGNEQRVGSAVAYVADSRAYAIAPAAASTILLMAPWTEMPQMLAQREPTSLARPLEELRRSSDDQRHFTLLCAPDFWTTSGKNWLGPAAPDVREWRDWFFSRGTIGALWSAHIGESLFGELRLAISADEPPVEAGRAYHQRVQQLAARVQDQMNASPPSDYTRPVLERFPRMLAVLDAHTRLSVEGRQVIARTYLPVEAAHNLVLGARLLVDDER